MQEIPPEENAELFETVRELFHSWFQFVTIASKTTIHKIE